MNSRRATRLARIRDQQRQKAVIQRDYQRLLGNKLRDMFPNLHSRGQAVKALDGYDDGKPEAYRVRLAILKLSGADLAEIKRHVEGAVEDHEDIISWAEAPRQMKCAIGNRKLTQIEREQISAEDRNDFEKWLRGSLKVQR